LNRYYTSLCRGLVGYYVAFDAPSEDMVREHLQMYFGRMWCSVYTQEQLDQAASNFAKHGILFGNHVINADNPIVLEEAEWE